MRYTATILYSVLAATLLVGCAASVDGEGTMPDSTTTLKRTPMENGFAFEGPHGLDATIVRNEGHGWALDGSFTFPTAGFEVAEPVISVLKRLPEHVIVTLRITPPDPDAVVAQVITSNSFNASIGVSHDATFELVVNTLEPGTP